MKSKIRILACILAVAGLAAGCDGAEADNAYYVDCSAARSGSGSRARPWNNLDAVNETTFAPGDSILLRRGTTCDGTLWPKGSGAEGAPIVVDAYGEGTKPHIAGGGAPNAVYLYNQEYWEIRNLEVTNTGAYSENRRGVYVSLEDFGAGAYYRLVDLTVHDVNGDNIKDRGGSSGIHFDVHGAAVQTKFSDVVIEGNTVYTVDRSGINMSSAWWCRESANCFSGQEWYGWDPFVIRGNLVYDVGGDGIVNQYACGSTVEYNVVHHANARSGTANAGIWAWNADDVTFQYNEAFEVQTTLDGQGFDIDYGQSGTIMQYNYSHDNEGGFMLICGPGANGNVDGVVRYNVSQNDRTRVFHVSGLAVTNAQIYNNTIYVGEGLDTTILLEGPTHSAYFWNNIFCNLGSGGYAWATDRSMSHIEFDYNVYYGHHDISEPSDPHRITDDPLLVDPGSGGSGIDSVDGYQLQAGSPAIATGRVIPDNGGQDYWGNPLPDGCPPDRGAHQFASVCVTPVPTGTPDPNRTYIENPGFESGELSPWVNWYVVDLAADGELAHSGDHAVALGMPGSVEQDVVGLQPGTAYLLSGWARAGEEGGIAKVGVTGHEEGEQLFQVITDTAYVQATVPFTTGADVTAVTVFCRHPLGGEGTVYCDDFTMTGRP